MRNKEDAAGLDEDLRNYFTSSLIGIAMKNRRIESLQRNALLWVWDGAWLPASVIETPLEAATGVVLVRFRHGVSAPVHVSRVAARNPALRDADRPSAGLSATMYAASLRSDAPAAAERRGSLHDDRRTAGSIFQNAFAPMDERPAPCGEPDSKRP